MHALEERGYLLAKGDRAAIVAVDIHGEVHSIANKLGKKIRVKDVRARIGDESDLPSVAKVKEQISQGMLQALGRFKTEADETQDAQSHAFEFRKNTLVQRQRIERQTQSDTQERRQVAEAKQRQERFRTGLKGVWDRLRGEHNRIQHLNEKEATDAHKRDVTERDLLTHRHLDQRNQLDIFKMHTRRDHTRQHREIEADRKVYCNCPIMWLKHHSVHPGDGEVAIQHWTFNHPIICCHKGDEIGFLLRMG